MPIKPENRARYPKDWKAISLSIRARAAGQCECMGECGLHRDGSAPRRCQEFNGLPALYARGKVVLTVAHLDHTPENCAPENLKAMCQRCHLRYDADHHRKNASATRARKPNQMEMFP
jgi:5-methylcytosine-specific restriction endonuclease McrA